MQKLLVVPVNGDPAYTVEQILNKESKLREEEAIRIFDIETCINDSKAVLFIEELDEAGNSTEVASRW